MTSSREISGVHISYGPYLRAYGKSPRGRGSWAFTFSGEDDPRFFYGTLPEACRLATREAKALGITSLALES